MTDEQLAGFVTPKWLESVAAVPADEIAAMVCEDPSVVVALIGALRHARAGLGESLQKRIVWVPVIAIAKHWRDQEGVNGVLLDRLADEVEKLDG